METVTLRFESQEAEGGEVGKKKQGGKPSPTSNNGYDITVGEGVLEQLPSFLARTLDLRKAPTPSSLVIVTDNHVAKIYGPRLLSALSQIPKEGAVRLISIRAGERSKTLDSASTIASKLSLFGVDRRGVLIALGGGVVGDLTGFVASIYKRGISYFQVPTTLLAQIDSSIGGKTGVDTFWGKNQLGTFCQPTGVVIDPLILKTLPKKEVINGLAEMIKYGVIYDRSLFFAISKECDAKSSPELKRFILRCCEIKAGVVSKDEREEGLRSILNFGHTVGHAIEAASNYALNHGSAVILGMIAEGWVAVKLGIFDSNDFEVLERLLCKFSSARALNSLRLKDIKRFAYTDKKGSSRELRMSIPAKIGRMYTEKDLKYTVPVSGELFTESLHYLQNNSKKLNL